MTSIVGIDILVSSSGESLKSPSQDKRSNQAMARNHKRGDNHPTCLLFENKIVYSAFSYYLKNPSWVTAQLCILRLFEIIILRKWHLIETTKLAKLSWYTKLACWLGVTNRLTKLAACEWTNEDLWES